MSTTANIRYYLREGFRNIGINRLMSVASVAVLMSCLVLIGSALLIFFNVDALLENIESQNVIMAFCDVGSDEDTVAAVGEAIEKLDNIETFHPSRMASRILGMGDVLSLIEKAEQQLDMQKAQELAEKLKKNRFTLQDYYDQLVQVKNMGSMEDLLGMMPGMNAKALEGATIND